VTGNDKKRYMFRVKDMIAFLPTENKECVIAHVARQFSPALSSSRARLEDATGHDSGMEIFALICHVNGQRLFVSFRPISVAFGALKTTNPALLFPLTPG
jgi:hypothetical protein